LRLEVLDGVRRLVGEYAQLLGLLDRRSQLLQLTLPPPPASFNLDDDGAAFSVTDCRG
jgi:hypothetical protein